MHGAAMAVTMAGCCDNPRPWKYNLLAINLLHRRTQFAILVHPKEFKQEMSLFLFKEIPRVTIHAGLDLY